MKQLDLILYLIELETMTEQLIEGLKSKLETYHLNDYEEGHLDGKIMEKQRLLFIIKDIKSLLNTEHTEQSKSNFNKLTEYKQIIQGIIDADEREMW